MVEAIKKTVSILLVISMVVTLTGGIAYGDVYVPDNSDWSMENQVLTEITKDWINTCDYILDEDASAILDNAKEMLKDIALSNGMKFDILEKDSDTFCIAAEIPIHYVKQYCAEYEIEGFSESDYELMEESNAESLNESNVANLTSVAIKIFSAKAMSDNETLSLLDTAVASASIGISAGYCNNGKEELQKVFDEQNMVKKRRLVLAMSLS